MVDLNDVAFYSQANIDKVFAVFNGTLTISNAVKTATIELPVSILPGQYPLFDGYFRVQGSALWTPANDAGYPPQQKLSGIDYNTFYYKTNKTMYTTVSIANRPNFPDGANRVIDYEVILFDSSNLTVVNIDSSINTSLDSRFNYLKIYMSGTLTGSTTHTITHNLGYKPTVRVYEDSGIEVHIASLSGNTVEVTDTQVIIGSADAGYVYEYRIYLDE